MKTETVSFTQHWHRTLKEYVTALTWTPNGAWLAAASAAGEVVLCQSPEAMFTLQQANSQAINGLSFSADGQFLAIGDQSGTVTVWAMPTSPNDSLEQLSDLAPYLQHTHPSVWIDQLTWHPHQNILAYGVGPQVQIWAVAQNTLVTELDFQDSSILHMAWHPHGTALAVSGHGGVKVWQWDDLSTAPRLIAVPGASLHIAWSAEGHYLGSGNLDRTLTVTELDDSPPWLMQGFPGKVRQLAWSTLLTPSGSPLLAAACAEGIILWQRSPKSKGNWRSRVLKHHQARVNAIAFQPNSRLLASASQDRQVGLWQDGKKLFQILKGFRDGVSCLAWHPSGEQLAAGGIAGEILVWKSSHRARGFG